MTLSGAHVIEVQDLMAELSRFSPNEKVHLVLHHEGDSDSEDDQDMPVFRVERTSLGIGIVTVIPTRGQLSFHL